MRSKVLKPLLASLAIGTTALIGLGATSAPHSEASSLFTNLSLKNWGLMGQGLAKKMIRQAAQTALTKGIKKVTLEVRKSNASAIQLYQGLRFVITHVKKGFYSNGEDAYQMVLLLEDQVPEF